MPLVAGVDSSTTSCKVCVYDADSGDLVASGFGDHPNTTPPRSEQHPASWLVAFEQAAAEARLFTDHRPAAIAIAGQQHGLVVLDRDRRVIRPAKLWNDTESAGDATELTEALPDGSAGWVRATGSALVASTTITKLRWLRRNEPAAFDQIATVMLPHDWLTMQLTQRSTTDRGDASGTGWWSPGEGRYRFDLLALVDPDRDWSGVLPDVLGPSDQAGHWPVLDAVVGPGTGDNMAAAVGLGLRPGDVAFSLGTSGTAFCVADQAPLDPTGKVSGFADATGRYLPLVCTLNATKVTATMARLFAVPLDEFDRLALAACPGAGGLVLIPHLDGERTPDRPDATGSLVGMRSNCSREELARATVEGVICNLLEAADHLGPWVDRSGGRVMVVGGGSRSKAHCQVLADLIGRPILVPGDQQLVARGAAIGAVASLQGRSVAEVAAGWPLTADAREPSGADGESIRATYRARAEDVEPAC